MKAALRKQSDSINEQLLKLYWNRADVKRELNSLQRERFLLLDRLKNQEDEIVRAQEQLVGLERLLVNPGAAANAMVYFQLRHLWRVGAARLERFSGELVSQRHNRERARLQDAAVAKRQRRLKAIESSLQSMQRKLETVNTATATLDKRLSSMNRVMQLIGGARLRSERAEHSRRASILVEKIDEAKLLHEKLQGEPLPEPEGLSLDSRRAINTALIALSQHLVLHFSASNLVTLAKTATERSVGDMKFGDRRECDRMVETIRHRIADLRTDEQLAEVIRERAASIARDIQYRDENSAVPAQLCVPSIAPVTPSDKEGRRATDAPVQINVVADDYFDLSRYFA